MDNSSQHHFGNGYGYSYTALPSVPNGLQSLYFTPRNAISYKTIAGEAKSVDMVQVNDSKKNILPKLIEGYHPRDIYNADETGLFYQAKPNKTLDLRGKDCVGFKESKLRVTLLFACNADGSYKLKPLFIGKSKRPRCLVGLNMNN